MSNIAIIGKNSVDYISLLLDIWSHGDCAVLLDWQTPFSTALRMLKEADVEKCYVEDGLHIINTDCLPSEIEFFSYKCNSHQTNILPASCYHQYTPNYSEQDAVVIYSSGTTGAAKGIVLSYYAINTNADAILDYMHPTSDDCIYIVKNLTHSSTITGELLVALKSRAKLIISPTIVPPRYVLNNIEQQKVSILCLNPTLLSLYAKEAKRKNYQSSSLKAIYVSGSILSDQVRALAHDAFPNIAICNAYGLSEAGPRVSAQRMDAEGRNSAGLPIRGVEIKIVNESGEVLNSGEYGIVHVNTPCLFSRYTSGKEKYPSRYQNWLNTGDIGYLDEHGELNIVNRVDDLIVLNSHKIYPRDIETVIINNTNVYECIVLKWEQDNKTELICVYTQKAPEPNEHFISKLKKILLPYEIPNEFIFCNQIPRNTNGKISKVAISKTVQQFKEKHHG